MFLIDYHHLKALRDSFLSPWLVVNEEVRDVVPHVAVVVEVVHRRLQGRLQRVWVIFKQPQDDAPHQGGKQRERVVFGLGDESFLHGEPWQCEQDSGQQVHIDLEEQEHSVTWHAKPANVGVQNQLWVIYLLVWCHTWLLMLLLSPNTKYPPTQAARKAWDWELFPCILSCSACSPLYVNTKYARLREWVYVALKMALSLSFKLPERGRSVHTERANELGK